MIVLMFVCCMLVREREKRKDKKAFKQDFLLLVKTNPTCLFSLTSTATHLFPTTRRGSEWGRWGNRTCRSGIEQKDSVHGGKPSGFRACHPASRLFNGVFVLASCTSTTIIVCDHALSQEAAKQLLALAPVPCCCCCFYSMAGHDQQWLS